MKNNDLIFLFKKVKWPKKLIVISTFLLILSSISSLIIPYYTGKIVDFLSAENFNTTILFIFLLVFILDTILNGCSTYVLSKIGEKIIYSIKADLWKQLLSLKMNFFDKNNSGNLMSRITDDTNIINNFISERIPSIIPSLFILVGSVIMLLLLDWQMTLLSFLVLPIFIVIIIPLGNRMEKISVSTQNEISEFSGLLGRVLTEMKLVKVSSSESMELSNAKTNLKKIYELGLKEAKIRSIISPISGLILLLTVSIILGFGGYRVSINAISAGTLVSMIFYVIQLAAPLLNLTALVTEYKKTLGASKRIVEIYHEESENDLFSDVSENYLRFKHMEFKNVTFSYEQKVVLSNITFEVQSGEMIAIVGPSGSGKTTILNLIERLYNVENGAIYINGENLNEISLNIWRKKVGYVMQSNAMVSGTVMDNLLYGLEKKVTKDQIIRYTKLAYCYDFINKLPQKFDTQIGERGTKLSGGQKQRIDIARCFIKNPDILLLDEATSNLDSESEIHIHNGLRLLMKSRTTFIIAHRLSTIKEADKILFLDNGEITGIGSHLELLKTHTKYKKFVDSQNI